MAIHPILNEAIIRAFGWTLVHSLWQGLLMAILGGLLVLVTRRSAPALRYHLFSVLFVLFFLAAGTTFVLELQAGKSGDINGRARFEPIASAIVFSGRSATPNHLSALSDKMSAGGASNAWALPRLADGFVKYFNDHAMVIVIIWFVLFSTQLAMMAINLGNIHRLRYSRTAPPSEYWLDRIRELARLLGIRKEIFLLESAIIRVPMMAGLFKPVILIPLGLLAQIPSDQVEAILLHELAHIRRKDYLMNLLQSFGEALFFFNPGVWWISSLIREERENCCDDMAIGVAKNKKGFITALVSFQEYNMTASRYAIAFPGSRNHLLRRVKRIVYRDNKTLDIREKYFMLVCIFIIGGLTLAFSHSSLPAAIPVAASTYRHSPLIGIGQGSATNNDVRMAEGQAGGQVNKARVSVTEDMKVKIVAPILNRLLEEGVIHDTLKVSFDLCERGLIVNGVKQRAGVAGPLQAQYIQNSSKRILYTKARSGHETTMIR